MPTSTPIVYPLDLTGKHPDNLIVGEPHTVGAAGNRAIVLNHGPFFTKGLVIRRASNGQILTPRVHYKAAQLFSEATIKTGLEVCSIIVMDDLTTGTDFLIDYQTIGGDYAASVNAIEQLVATLELDDRPVRWGSILGKPIYFPPTPHLHDLGDLYGFEYVVAALEGVRQAILLGDAYKDQEIYDYIDRQDASLSARVNNAQNQITGHINNLNNPHQTTKGQVGLGNVENYPVADQQVSQAGLSNVHYMTPLRTQQLVSVHATRTDNPHNTTASQVGLGNVSNYATATLTQAVEATRDDLFVTPRGVKAMIDAYGGSAPPPPPPPPSENPPIAKFIYSGSVVVAHNANHTLQFTDQSTANTYPITGWAWVFRLKSDNSQLSTSNVQSPSVTFTRPGNYTVIAALTVTNSNGTAVSTSQEISLSHEEAPTVVPTVDFTWTGATTVQSPTNHVLNYTSQVTAGSSPITSYFWDLNWGAAPAMSSSLQNVPNVTYSSLPVGTHTITVKLTVTTQDGLSYTKTKTLTLVKTAANAPPTSNFTFSGATTVQAPTVHVLTFTNQSSQGSASITTYQWNFGDGTTHTGANPPPKSYPMGVGSLTYTVSLTVTDANNLTNVFSRDITLTKTPEPLNPPVANFNTSGQTTVMEGSNHTISAASTSSNGSGAITSYSWDWGDGSAPSSGPNPPPHQYSVPVGTHQRTITLTVIDSNGLQDTEAKTVTLVKNPITPPTSSFNAGGAMTVTEPSNHSINFSDASVNGTGAINRWEWDFGDGTTHDGQSPPTKTYGVPVGTTYVTVRLRVTDVYGRQSTSQQTLTLTKNRFTLPGPMNLDFEQGDTGWNKGQSTTIEALGGVSGAWSAITRNTAASGAYADMSGALINYGANPVTVGEYVGGDCWIRPSSGSSGKGDNVVGAVRLMWLDYYGNVIGQVPGNAVQMATRNNQWTQSAAAGYAPEGAYYYTVQGDCFIRWGGASVGFDAFTLGTRTPGGGGGVGGGVGGGGVGGGGTIDGGVPQNPF